MKMQKFWYLGFLGLIGFYFVPDAIHAFEVEGHWLEAQGLLWFGWFLCFWPEEADTKEEENVKETKGENTYLVETIESLLSDENSEL